MVCKECGNTDLKILKSSTKSKYIYCEECNYNLDAAYKNMVIDTMLKKMVEHLSYLKSKELRIEIKKTYNNIKLVINNINVFLTEFRDDFNKRDIQYVESIVSELVEDHCQEAKQVDIIVSK